MAITIHGHPWSINTRKVLAALAEKGESAELSLVMVPKGEHKRPEHLARHPFGKVPVLEEGGELIYETRAILRYLEHRLPSPALVPSDATGAAHVEQWINVAESYFIPFAHPLLVESLFRQYIGGEQNAAVIRAGREGVGLALDVAGQRLQESRYFAGNDFSLADIYWMPYFEYLLQVGEGELVLSRKHLAAWWERVSERSAWQRVARSGPQPYERGMTADVIERLYRGAA
jgi:glutathione S-transferase